MKLDQLKSHLGGAFAALESSRNNHLVYGYLGAPGVGKTAMICQAAQEVGAEVIQMIGSTLSPTDIVCMMPNTTTGMMDPMFNSEVPWESRVGNKRVVWFIDECTNIHGEVWKSLQKLVHERELFGRKLGPNVAIVLAGNRTSDKAGSATLATAVYNRVSWYEWDYDNDEFVRFLLRNGAPASLAAYITMRPLSDVDFSDAVKTIGRGSFVAWASPRSVHRLATRMNLNAEEFSMADLRADLGEGRAAEYFGFRRMVDELPPVSRILADPEECELPVKIDQCYALTTLLAQRADVNNLKAIHTYMKRMDLTMQILTLRIIVTEHKGTKLLSAPAFMAWVTQPGMADAILGV